MSAVTLLILLFPCPGDQKGYFFILLTELVLNIIQLIGTQLELVLNLNVLLLRLPPPLFPLFLVLFPLATE